MTTERSNLPEAPESKPEARKQWMYIMLMVNIVFVLLLITLGIVALRVGNYLPENTDILFIVGKNPNVEVSDQDETSWKTGQQVNIFQSTSANEQGEITVASQDGTKVIAPGTQTTYQFTMCNSGNMAVHYETDLDFTLKVGNEKQESYQFPLLVRLSNASGVYLIGGEDEWVNVADATLSRYVSVLGASSYETFTLELLWQFEGGNDELDTLYGDLSAEKGVTLILGINTYAEEHIEPDAQGGTRMAVQGTQEYGGTIRWLWLFMLLINTGVLIFYVAWLMNKRLKKW